MDWRSFLAVLVGKFIAAGSRLFNMGAGETWSGEVALLIDKDIVKKLIRGLEKIVLIAGTNGKTTTSKMLRTILESSQEIKIVHNETGANLLNGIAGALLKEIGFKQAVGPISQRRRVGIFEVDEGALAAVLTEFTPDVLLLLNLFRDQLDRYGEVRIVAKKWRRSLGKLSPKTSVILNADDPQVAYLGEGLKARVKFFGMKHSSPKTNKKNRSDRKDFWADSLYCPKCRRRLFFEEVYFSHLGNWCCRNCGLARPKLEIAAEKIKLLIEGKFNLYNAAAAILAAREIGVEGPPDRMTSLLKNFAPAFGRGEEIRVQSPKSKVQSVKIFLSKNPTGFNENIRLISSKCKTVLIVLNDRVPDGRDVSWIWDVDFKPLIKSDFRIIISGDRAEDMSLRLKYSIKKYRNIIIEKNLKKAIMLALEEIAKSETLYILANYSAMLAVRKILLGREIL